MPAKKRSERATRAFANDAFANESHARKGLARKRRAGRSDTNKSFANRRVVVENVEHYYCILRRRKTAREQE